ncbi:MAG: regulatory protein GemA [Rhodobacter sp.]|nr:regulatory protein GemA [Rhodobacter sp.]
MTRALQKLIHAGCRQLGLDEDTRRGLQRMATGKDSLRDMTEEEMENVLLALKSCGFTPSPGAAPRRKAAERGDVRFAYVLWGKLFRAGAVDKAGAAGLNAFIRARFGKSWGAAPIDIDAMRDWQQIATVIEALKAMCIRAGIDLGARP